MIDFQSLGGSASFYFTRHGESEGNRDGIMQGRTPSTLTDKGRAQARQAGLWFRPRGIKTIVSSPLARAGQTARIIADETGVSDLRFLDELVEIDTGIFSNLTRAEARAKYPEAWLSFTRESWEGVPGSEKIEEILRTNPRGMGQAFRRVPRGKGNPFVRDAQRVPPVDDPLDPRPHDLDAPPLHGRQLRHQPPARGERAVERRTAFPLRQLGNDQCAAGSLIR